jgi:choice-of-anchor A domain-containing protein
VTISTLETTLDGLSTSLSKLKANSVLPTAGNNEVISATPGANGVAVFDVTAAQLAQIPSYDFDLNGAKTVIINVSGTTVNFSANDESGTTGANNIIWNFYQAKTVNLGTQIAGTILATGATVSNNNQIDGDLVAAAWTGNGELHDYAFTGNLSAVPLPGGLPLLGSALLALGALARRRAKKGSDASLA